MTEPNLYNVGYDVGFEDGFKEAQARALDDLGDDPEIMAATRAEWAARAKTAEAKLAKAIKTLECYAGHWVDDKTFIRTDDGGELADETIAELTGGKDE